MSGCGGTRSGATFLRMNYEPIINTQSDLEAAWRHLMGPLGFGSESLWLMFVRPDGIPIPQLSQIEDCDEPPSREELAGFADFLAHFASEDEPGLRLAALRTRPGSFGPNDVDRQWAQIVYAACRTAKLPVEVVHLATDQDIYPLPWDALGSASTSMRSTELPPESPAA